MPGGLMNLVSVGQQNIVLNGNPSKTFLKPLTHIILILVCKSFASTLKVLKHCGFPRNQHSLSKYLDTPIY